MRINPRNLRRRIGANAQGTARKLVNKFEGLQVERLAGPCQERLKMLQHGRHDELIAIAASRVEEKSTKLFDVTRLGGQDIGNLIGQLP